MVGSERRAAFHEAGHTVAQLSRGLHVEQVTILPEGETDGRVFARLANPPTEDESATEMERALEGVVVVLLAGGVAEKLDSQAAEYGRGWEDDLSQATDPLQVLFSTRPWAGDFESFRTFLLAKASLFVKSNQGLIEDIAAELLRCKTLTSSQVNQFVDGRPIEPVPDDRAACQLLAMTASS